MLNIPEITGGVLLSRQGQVHRRSGETLAECGQRIPARHVAVSHVQAVVHKLPLCLVCFRGHHQHGARFGGGR